MIATGSRNHPLRRHSVPRLGHQNAVERPARLETPGVLQKFKFQRDSERQAKLPAVHTQHRRLANMRDNAAGRFVNGSGIGCNDVHSNRR
jgi:hypothetical protein